MFEYRLTHDITQLKNTTQKGYALPFDQAQLFQTLRMNHELS